MKSLPKPIVYIFFIWLMISVLTFGLIFSNLNQAQSSSDDLAYLPEIETGEDSPDQFLPIEIESTAEVNLINLNNRPTPTARTGNFLEGDSATTTRPLSAYGILHWLNQVRAAGGVSSLNMQNDLILISETALNQNVFNQSQLLSLAQNQGHQFSVIGSVFGFGRFTDEQTLIEAWQKDPLNRSVLLDHRFTQVGIALKTELDEENNYQTNFFITFSRRPPSCLSPETALRERISRYQNLIKDLEEQIVTLNASDNIEMEEYGVLINQYQSAKVILEATTAEYNSQARRYNNCLLQ